MDKRSFLKGAVAGATLAWVPNPGSQILMLSCPYDEILLFGDRGGGKTECLLVHFAQNVGRGYGSFWQGILFRQTYKQLADVVVKSRRLFGRAFPAARFIGGDQYKWVWPTGEQLLLRQIKTKEGYWDYHGHEYPWIGWEEITNWKDMEPYEAMKACNRSSHPTIPRQIVSTTNPYGVGHSVVKAYWDPDNAGEVIEEFGIKRVAIRSSFVENPYILLNDPQYINRLRSIKDPNLRKAWLYGSFDITGGGALNDLYSARTHMLKLPKDYKWPEGWPISRSFDWGSSRPFSTGWHITVKSNRELKWPDGATRKFFKGTKIRLREWYGWTGEPDKGAGLTNRQIGAGIIEREADWDLKDVEAGAADSAIFATGTGFGRSQYSEIEAEGAEFVPSIKGPGSRRRRLSVLRTALDNSLSYPMEGPGYFGASIEACPQMHRIFTSLPRDDLEIDCVDSESEDHLFDEVTYELTRDHHFTLGFEFDGA